MKKKKDKDLFTIPEVCSMLPGKGKGGKSHPSRIYRWIDSGIVGMKLPATGGGSGGFKMVRRSDLCEFLHGISRQRFPGFDRRGIDVLLERLEGKKDYKRDFEERSLAVSQGGSIAKGQSAPADGPDTVEPDPSRRWVGYCIPLQGCEGKRKDACRKNKRNDYDTAHLTMKGCIEICENVNKKRGRKRKPLLVGIRQLYWPHRALVKSNVCKTEYLLADLVKKHDDEKGVALLSAPALAAAPLDSKMRDTLTGLTELVSTSLGKMERQIRSVEKLTMKIEHLTNLGGSLLSAIDRCAAGMGDFNSNLPIQVVPVSNNGDEDQQTVWGGIAKKMLGVLKRNPQGMTKSVIKAKLSGACTKELTGKAMQLLLDDGSVQMIVERKMGRDIETWFAIDPCVREEEEDK